MNTLTLTNATRYTGFSPSYKQIPATKNINVINEAPEKNYYEQISNNKKLKIPYFQKNRRWESNYQIGQTEADNQKFFSPQTLERKKLGSLSKINKQN